MNALTALALISRPTASDARAMIDNYKVTTGCIDCGFTGTPAALHFDHRDPSTKYRTRTGRAVHPADMIKAGRDGYPRYSWATILGEISKCDVRCANCHAARTTRQQLADPTCRGCGVSSWEVDWDEEMCPGCAYEREMGKGIARLQDLGINWD